MHKTYIVKNENENFGTIDTNPKETYCLMI